MFDTKLHFKIKTCKELQISFLKFSVRIFRHRQRLCLLYGYKFLITQGRIYLIIIPSLCGFSHLSYARTFRDSGHEMNFQGVIKNWYEVKLTLTCYSGCWCHRDLLTTLRAPSHPFLTSLSSLNETQRRLTNPGKIIDISPSNTKFGVSFMAYKNPPTTNPVIRNTCGSHQL